MAERYTGPSAKQIADLIWTAHEPVSDATARAPEKRPWWKRKPVVVGGVMTLLIAAPLLTLDGELVFFNLFGLGIAWLLLRRFMR